MRGAGRVLPSQESSIPRPNFLVCPNITPDRETGAGSWSDQQLMRAIRQGVGHDGRILHKTMPYWNFRYLTDEDLASIIVFLRSIPAVHHLLPKRNFAEQPVIDWRPEIQPRPLSSDAPAAARHGEYLVPIGNCTGCHTTADPQGRAVPGMLFGPYRNQNPESGSTEELAEITRAASSSRLLIGRLGLLFAGGGIGTPESVRSPEGVRAP